jgi:hypothetical protein
MLEKSDVKALLEGPWQLAREDMFSGRAQQPANNLTSTHRVAFGLERHPKLMQGGPPLLDQTLNDRL